MKFFTQKIFLLPFTIIIIISSLSANKSNWSGMDLTQDEMNNCIHFQLSRGSNCIGEFKKLEPFLNRFIERRFNSDYLVNILGKPNNETVNLNKITDYSYILTEKLDENVVHLFVRDGVLLSYKYVSFQNK